MKLAYLANIRFPSERAHSAQINHMCSEYAKLTDTTVLFVSDRVSVNVDSSYKIERIYGGSKPPTSLIGFYISEIRFFTSFIYNRSHRTFDAVVSRSEFLLFLLSFTRIASRLVWESHDGRRNLFVKYLLRKGVFCVVTSEGQRDMLLTKHHKSILIAPNAIEDSFLDTPILKNEARKSLGLDPDKFLVGYIGGFDTWKGVGTFFEAAKEAPVDIQFVAIGGAELEVAANQKQFPKVKFLGSRPYEELAKNQQAFDVLVIPNTAKNDLSAKYTSPLKLFAHMASGVPIVASDIPSIVSVTGRELVTLCAPDNPEALLQAVELVREQYTDKTNKAMQLREVAARYTWEARAKKILAFLGYTTQS